MYKFDGSIIMDNFGSMATKSPDASYVAEILTNLFREGAKLEKLYDLLMTEYTSENDFYTLLSDVDEVLDDIDLEALDDIRNAYSFGRIYSTAERWIMSQMFILYNSDKSSDNSMMNGPTLLETIRDMAEECEYISVDELQVYAADLYQCIAAMYAEIYNTYGLNRWAVMAKDGYPFINDITRGFNEFLVKMNMSPEEMADYIYAKTQKFVLVTNEVDKDPEISKKVRSMVPDNLRDEFEDIIEMITIEQVEDMLSGKIRINRTFINKMSDCEDDEQGEGE